MRSLRSRLLVGMVLGMVALLVGFGALVYTMIRRSLQAEFDAALLATARALIAAIEVDDDKIEMDLDPEKMPEFHQGEGSAYFQYWAADGTSLIRSASLGRADLAPPGGAVGKPVFRHQQLPDGLPGRAVGIKFAGRPERMRRETGKQDRKRRETQMKPKKPRKPRKLDKYEAYLRPGPVTLVVARNTLAMDARLGTLQWVLLGAGAATVALALLVSAVVVRRGLRPLDSLAARIGDIREEDLADRIPPGPMPAELLPVRERLNDLLARLEAAIRRERSFTANVAHELRTPLAGLRTTMEVALSRARDADEYAEAIGDCLRIAVQMQAMVENLLSLARLEADRIEVQQAPVVVNDVIRASWSPLAEAAEARRLQVRWALGPDVSVTTDPTLIALVVRNLLGNAVAYAEEGGSVTIETAADDDRITFRITNTGSKVPEDQVRHLFERFWRGDAARSGAGIHCGLGLSLVKKVMDVLGGSIEARSRAGGEFVIEASLPR